MKKSYKKVSDGEKFVLKDQEFDLIEGFIELMFFSLHIAKLYRFHTSYGGMRNVADQRS
jgi:hypothetical protein